MKSGPISFLVANPKGGVGKSTLSTNLAGYFARCGHSVMLGDIDRQQSSRQWLGLRSPALPPIQSWDVRDGEAAQPPAGTTHCVLDTPAGLHGKQLSQVLKRVDRVVVPLQPSIFDILATREFLEALAEEKAIRNRKAFVAIVGMRVDPRTRAAAQLERFLDDLGLPALAYLRDTQIYVQAAAHGMTIFDLSESRGGQDWAQWRPIMDWADASNPTA